MRTNVLELASRHAAAIKTAAPVRGGIMENSPNYTSGSPPTMFGTIPRALHMYGMSMSVVHI